MIKEALGQISKKFVKKDQRKIKILIESPKFDLMIMCLILLDAIVLGTLTFDNINANLLFLLDRLFVAMFIVEMVLKIVVLKSNFFKVKWNVFDLIVISISAIPMASSFIIIRTFRLFRYIDKSSKLNDVFEALTKMIAPLFGFLLIVGVLFYVYAIIGVSLYGMISDDFSSLFNALFALLQVFTLDNWASGVAKDIMIMIPSAWIYFVSFLFFSFSAVLGFVVGLVKNKSIVVT